MTIGMGNYEDGEEDFRHYWRSNHLHKCACEPVPPLCHRLGCNETKMPDMRCRGSDLMAENTWATMCT